MKEGLKNVKDLPDNCPNCKEKVDFEYHDIEAESGMAWQKAVCPECSAEFCEVYELVGWEQL